MRYRYYFWTLLLISAVLFFAPITVEEQAGSGLDKLVHIGLFAGLLFLGDRGYRADRGDRRRIIILLLLAGYAVLVEVVQGEFLPYRSFDGLDIAADVIGLALAMALSTSFKKRNE